LRRKIKFSATSLQPEKAFPSLAFRLETPFFATRFLPKIKIYAGKIVFISPLHPENVFSSTRLLPDILIYA